MIINNFYIKGIAVFEAEAQAPLVIYANALLALAISTQSFQPVAWR